MPMIRELAYDRVLHSQQHFRSILSALSRPGTINELGPVPLSPPAGLNAASALVSFALINADVGFHLVHMTDVDAGYLNTNTGARAVPIEEAAFIFTEGQEPPAMLEGASCGSLTYPDTAATIVVQVAALSLSPQPGGLMLTLEGPGIDGRAQVSARGLSVDLLLALQARNAEFPLGIDALLTCDDGGAGPARVVGIPRTARVTWEAC
jgi:alpha-D-ribose 1-methylphosphonate 5-triphosphate synthase subunit PhnH